jgi:hypothetical protein
MKQDAKAIIGKTVTGVIARPAPGGKTSVFVLQFSDGSCFEFVSPAAARRIARCSRADATDATDLVPELPQLSMFPLDGGVAAQAA